MNSMSDIGFCMIGFTLAYLLPTRMTIILVIATEVMLALWIRDGFRAERDHVDSSVLGYPHLAERDPVPLAPIRTIL